MKIILLLVLVNVILMSESFLTKKEYAKMLYYNTRGIGCDKCHNDDSSGKVLINYIYKNRNKTIKALDLTKSTKEKFIKILSNRPSKKSIMPEYFLTKEEIEALYFYVNSLKKEKKPKNKIKLD